MSKKITKKFNSTVSNWNYRKHGMPSVVYYYKNGISTNFDKTIIIDGTAISEDTVSKYMNSQDVNLISHKDDREKKIKEFKSKRSYKFYEQIRKEWTSLDFFDLLPPHSLSHAEVRTIVSHGQSHPCRIALAKK